MKIIIEKYRQKFFVLIALFSLIIVLAGQGCSKDSNKKVTIEFWTMGAEAEHVQKLTKEFEMQNPDIIVKVQAIPWTAAHEKLITAYASETTPDIVQMGNTWIPEFVALNSLQSLDGFVDSSKIVNSKNYFPGIWQTNIIENKLYGIPWYVDTRVLFYRTDILKRVGYPSPPKNWDELYDVSKKIKALYRSEEKYSFFIPTNEWAPFIIFGLQADADLLKNNNSEGDFSQDKFQIAFKFLMRFYKEKLAPVDMTEVSNVFQAFASGFFAMYITGPWNVAEFKNRLPQSLQNDWMTAPLPAYDNQKYPGLSLAGGSSFSMFKSCKHKQEAWKLIEFLSERSNQIKFYHLSTDLPAVVDAWQDSTLKDDKYLKAFYEQLQNVTPMPKVPEWEQIVSAKVQQYAEYSARGKVTPDAALKMLDNDVDKILEKRRWILRKEKKIN